MRADVLVTGVAALRLAALALFVSCLGHIGCGPGRPLASLPPQLSDEEFWSLSTGLSEPPGAFRHSENLVSNEDEFPHTIRVLRPRGGVYVGVGPEQNFSYIARLEPAMAFIIDIRQENRNLHLLYKALFESAATRSEFVSRLFSRHPQQPFESKTSVHELFAAYDSAKPSAPLYEASVRLVRERLLDTHRFPLSEDDLRSITGALEAFYTDGPEIHYARSRPQDAPGPSYRSLMTATDVWGQSRSYLATEESFGFVKGLHARNLIVPIVGDFGGAGVIRRVGDYIRQRGSVVSAFYGSNVEVYLSRQQMTAFCSHLASLPYESRTWFIGSRGLRPLPAKLKTCVPVGR